MSADSLSNARPPVRPALHASDGARDWKRHLKEAFRDPEQLLKELEIDASTVPIARLAQFPLLAPRPFVDRMRRGDPNDPLLRQVLPLAAELEHHPGFLADPVDDAAATVAPGLLHKYNGRALLVAAKSCAVHCRYCFRRHYPYHTTPRSSDEWRPALEYLRANPSITEIILSGGDPLMLVDELLEELVGELNSISHIRRLRIHTRLPVVIPDRVTRKLTSLLSSAPLSSVIVLHINHPNELYAPLHDSLSLLRDSGAVLLNQAVLLRGINDDLDSMSRLSEQLIEYGVTPYYLHEMDRTAGTQHFVAEDGIGTRLTDLLRESLPGYLVPRYVREEPGAAHKTPLA